jgi:hypothetical protein
MFRQGALALSDTFGTALLVIFGPALLYLAITLPLISLAGLLRGWVSWRHRPLQQRNHIRAGVGAFLVMLTVGPLAHGVPEPLRPIAGYLIGGLGGFGLLWLCVGILSAHGARFDFMSAFWWAVAAVGCVALLVFKGVV